MEFISSLALTFAVTEIDVIFVLGALFITMVFYYFVSLHSVFEAAFGAIVGLGIYVLLSVLLLGNATFGNEGGLFPFGFSVIIVSIAVYLVFILAFLFPLHGGLVISEPTHPTLYTIIYFATTLLLFFVLWAVLVYMTEQTYVFRVGTVFTFFRDTEFYTTLMKTSYLYGYIMTHEHFIIPLAVMLMLYKLLLSNIVNAALLSIWYNLSNVSFYKKKDDAHYRVEFHEVGGKSGHDEEEDDADDHDSHHDKHHH
jgi:hypothetical protein